MSENMKKVQEARKVVEGTSSGGKPKYETPTVISLSEVSRGVGVALCNPGSSEAIDCTPGVVAGLCSTGTSGQLDP